jgi:CubicO group peptidase (beta-lactamase class C family)
MKLFRFIVLLFLLPAIVFGQKTPNVKDFDQYVQKAVADWQVPGLAIIVIKDNQVVFKKGYGIRQLNQPGNVNTETLFAIASTTKAMTAACAAMLVDEGKLHWEDKVTDYLPDFQLYDPYVTRELTVKDLFLHDSGVGNTDFLWGYMNIGTDEVLHRMRLVKPEYSFRSGFVYQNIFYTVAGKVIEKASGMPWETFIKQRIFVPLKMDRTVPMLKYTAGLPNVASGHAEIDHQIVETAQDNTNAISPAGGVWSCVDDMGKWVACMLDSGKFGNQRLLKPESWAMLLKPQTMVTPEEFYPTAQLTKPHWTTYGLGWFQQDYKGEKVDFHTGSLEGLVAINGMIVDKKVGVYILANLDHAEVRHALMFKAFDFFALGGNADWSADFLKLYGGFKVKREKREQDELAKRVLNTHPSLDMKAYAGSYTDPLFGSVTITAQNDTLRLGINNIITASVQHWNYDTFKGKYSNKEYGDALVTFTLDANGKVSTVNVDGLLFNKQN